MIIFYDKKTKEIFGVKKGRGHTEEDLKEAMIKPSNMDEKDIGKFLVPYKKKTRTETKDITELRLVDEKTGKVERVKVGEKEVEVGAGMEPEEPLKDDILAFEKGKKSIFNHKVKLKGDKVVGFEKKQS